MRRTKEKKRRRRRNDHVNHGDGSTRQRPKAERERAPDIHNEALVIRSNGLVAFYKLPNYYLSTHTQTLRAGQQAVESRG